MSKKKTTLRSASPSAASTEYIDNTPQRKAFGQFPQAWREDIRQALEVMQRGGVILYPTDIPASCVYTIECFSKFCV